MIMAIFSGERVFIITVILALLTIAIEKIERSIINKTNKVAKKDKSYYYNLSIGFYLICSNIISLIITNWIACR